VGTVLPEEDTSRPDRKISPERTGSNPAIARNTVVLPQPDGPSKQRISPSHAVNEMSRTAGLLGS
jgi:hypothetical protein